MRALGILLAACAALGCGSDDTSVKLDSSAVPEQRAKVRAFYSGHSLTDGIPEAIAAFTPSLITLQKPGDFDYEFQSIGGSLIRWRSAGLDPSNPGGGYQTGKNRRGENMDVLAELRAPATIAQGEKYNVLVITERHDLPWTIEHEQTAALLEEYVRHFQAANPDGDALLYHGWLELNGGPVADWIDYERDALPLWECVVSAVNHGLKGASQVRVLPGATALTDLVESMMKGEAPGVAGSEREKLALIFSDQVHLTPAGIYFMALVHYAALFGVSPEGASAPDGVSPDLAQHMQRIAWRHVSNYAKRAGNASERELAWCNDYAADVMCPRYYQYRKPAGGSLADRARFVKNALFCGSSPAFPSQG
jgi:hypothetical protein